MSEIVSFPDADERYCRELLKMNPLIDECVDLVMNHLLYNGFNVADPNCLPEYISMVESFFKLMLKSKGESLD